MSEDVKICPSCNAEYYAHITICKGCECELIYPSQKASLQKKASNTEAGLVCVLEGPPDQVSDLARALNGEGYDCKVFAPGTGKGCSANYGIFVEQTIAREAVTALEALQDRLYPELKEAAERLSQGLCPACGAALMGSGDECPDCGLFLGETGGGDCGGCGGH